jgi:cell division protease FtsH
MAMVLAAPAAFLWIRLLSGDPVGWGMPDLGPDIGLYLPAIALVLVLMAAVLLPMVGAGRSPHVLYRSSEIETSLDDVKGAGVVKDEVVRTLNLFLAGKTYMAKAMAREAGVPFLFVSSSAFQSMYYGQTNRKIRSYFKALRTAARKEGGAIGFIEEIDAIGAARSGMGSSTSREGISGVVNELLIQLQSFDEPPRAMRVRGALIDVVNRFLPAHRALRKPKATAANVLVIGATNRADDLDPALLRPGRFDRSIAFDLPNRVERREIIDYYLDKKAHDPELDEPERRATLAAITMGYSPVMIEHLFDEALVWALRRGDERLDWRDVQAAKMTEEIGLKSPVEYTEAERRRIATHEAGHATVAHLVGKDRKLEVLSIIKRKDALGLLAHSELEERFTKTRSEIVSLIQIAMGGMCAEELWFGDAGTGPAGDLQAATTAAAQMVGSLGMGGSLVSFDAAATPGGANLVAKVLASDAPREAVERILDDAKDTARRLLDTNRHLVEGLRDALLERDELVGDEILDVLQDAEDAHTVLDLRAAVTDFIPGSTS